MSTQLELLASDMHRASPANAGVNPNVATQLTEHLNAMWQANDRASAAKLTNALWQANDRASVAKLTNAMWQANDRASVAKLTDHHNAMGQ